MKSLLVLLLGGLSSVALADASATEGSQIPVEHYRYSQHLDIARVVSTSEIPNGCDVVPARMTYEDSQGRRHILEYLVMGNSCSG